MIATQRLPSPELIPTIYQGLNLAPSFGRHTCMDKKRRLIRVSLSVVLQIHFQSSSTIKHRQSFNSHSHEMLGVSFEFWCGLDCGWRASAISSGDRNAFSKNWPSFLAGFIYGSSARDAWMGCESNKGAKA